MNTREKNGITTYKVVFIGVMAALVYVLTMFRFPLLGSKVHFANAMALLSGLLLGPLGGGLAAGIGSGLYDLLGGGYGLDEALITTVSKFAMAWICAMIAGSDRERVHPGRVTTGVAVGALSYVALYMLKTFLYQRFVYGFPGDAVWATMLSKLPASLINAGFAMVVTPLFYAAILPPLHKTGALRRLDA